MRRSGLMLAALALGACAAPGGGPVAPAADPAGAQGRACMAAVAAHVGLAPEALSAEPAGATAAGNAVFLVRYGLGGRDDLHSCEVDAGARVLALGHPRA